MVRDAKYISSECYNNQQIHDQEMEQIFSKVWVPMCHISEMRNEGDFRTTQIAGVHVIAWNIGHGEIKAKRDTGVHKLSGNMEVLTTGFPLHCEVKHGGMVWVTLDPCTTITV